MTRTTLTAAALALLLVPGPGTGQEAATSADLETKMERLRTRLGPDAAAAIEQAVARAREADVAPGPVVDKALEGLAKGVPPNRLVPAVQSYVDRLARAAAVLGGQGSPSEIVAAADALGRGVPEAELRAVGRSAGGEHRAIALVVLGDLVEMGVPADRAASTVRQALSAGRSGEALLHLPGLVRRRVRAGAPPTRAIEQAREALRRGPPAGPPVPPGAGPPGEGQGPPEDAGPPEGTGPPEAAGPLGGTLLSGGAPDRR